MIFLLLKSFSHIENVKVCIALKFVLNKPSRFFFHAIYHNLNRI